MNFKTTFKAVCFFLRINFNLENKFRLTNVIWFAIFATTLLLQHTVHGQSVTITATGAGTFTVPCDVTSLTVQAWGGGGAGGGTNSNNSKGGGGGAGGTYVSSVIAVTPDQSINYFVGAGANGNTTTGASGAATWFNTTLTLNAQGGAGGAAPNNGTVAGGAGSTTLSIGTTRIAGTNGANGTTTIGGAGGNGGNSGGTGGNQINSGGNGNNGSAPGGGGGGAFVNNGSNRSGGDGGSGQLIITYTTSLNTYCAPTFTNAVEPITNVTFGGIINTTSAAINGTPDIEYFCQTASVAQGSTTNAISIKGNTDGNSTHFIRAYIDWDHNGVYGNNTNEIYDLGTIVNSTGVDAVTLNSNIAVPSSAIIGKTKIRIMKRFNGYSTDACQTGGGNGQAEEYVLNVTTPPPPTITSYPSSICAGGSIVISGTNLNGATSVTIGGTSAIITANNSTSITVTVGSGTTGLISVTTAGGTATSSTPIIVNALPGTPGTISSTSAPYCNPVTLSYSASAPVNVTWYWQTVANGTSIANSNTTYNLNTAGAQTIYLRARNNITGCWSANSSSITLTVIDRVTALATNPSPANSTSGVCYAGLNAMSSLTWTGPSNATNYAVYFGTTTTPPLVANLTVTNYTFGTLLPNTTYYWQIIPSNVCGNTSATPVVWSFTTSNGPCYCDATVTNGFQNINFINNVRFIGTLNDVNNLNTSYSNNPTGYQNFTGLPNRAIQAQGEGVNVFIESPSIAMIRAWVDWNNDGVFNTTGTEAVYTSNNVSAFSTTFGFVIPAAQTPGLYRIRLRTNSSGGSNNISPCGNIAHSGETEDYLFQVIASCSANVTSLIDGESCGAPSGGNAPVNLSVTGTAGTTEIRWYNALTGGTRVQTTPVSSGTTANWSPSIANTTIYYVTSFNGTCESQVRTRITATIKPVSNITYSPLNPESCGENSVVTLSASGDNELVTLINENFEQANLTGLGVFTGQTLGTNNAQANWQRRQSTFIPSQQVWFPAISSGLGTNKFAMATSDLGGSGYDNALMSPIVSTANFLNLTLTFRMYYSDYYSTAALDNVSLEVSTNGGTTWANTVTYNSTVGIGTRFSDISLNVPSTYLNRTNLRFRFRYTSGWADGVAIDDIKLFGQRPLAPSFDWGSTPVDAYQDFACTIPYASGTTIGTVYVKPTLAQLEMGTFNFTATATLNNGCTSSQPITITNRSRVWKGSVNQNWNNPNNWLPVGVPTIDNCVIIPSNVKIPIANAVLPGGYQAYAKNVTIKTAGNLEIISGNNLTVKEWIRNSGTDNFTIRNNASLIQIDNTPNDGPVKMDRTAMVKKTDYVYYSSPVDGFSMTNLSPSSSVKLKWLPTTSTTGGFVFGNWSNSSTDIMNLARGYIVKGPSAFVTAQALTATFDGTPRNGDITVPISRGNYTGPNTTYQGRLVTKDDDNYNLIGNPYPSAISANAFLANALNTNILGSIYLWPHGGVTSNANPSPFYENYAYNYNSADYITYNSMGSVPPSTFDGYVAAGQSFFVLMTDAGSSSESLRFTNGMRVSNNNSQFLRTVADSINTNTEPEVLELHRIWLDMILPDGKTSSTLVGYTPDATYELDRLFDTPIIDNTTQNLYSRLNEDAMIIQGRPTPVDETDRVPLGVLITQQGIHTIAINSLDGVFNDPEQYIYLEDVETGIVHNLKNAPYIFSVGAGRYDDRFILRYNNEDTLGTAEFMSNSELDIIKLNTNIKVSSENSPIESIAVYDVSGRLILDFKKLNVNEFKIPLDSFSQGTYIVKATLQNGKQKTKKIIH